jgi:formylmethanofuran dehydrogenase subunit E
MNAQEIMAGDDFKKCEDFHGHVCPGLSIGYRAATMAMTELDTFRSRDEEVVTIVETDACCVDAIQVLTGCTFGKGNLIYRDHGKLAFTFFSRDSGKGIRLVMKPDALTLDEDHRSLMKKVMDGTADDTEKKAFEKRHIARSGDVLTMPAENLFSVQKVDVELPAKARIEPSEVCDQCNESVMRTKLTRVKDKKLCRACHDMESLR